MSELLQDYLPLVVFIAVAIGIGLALLVGIPAGVFAVYKRYRNAF